jgi:hypothetical protein
LLRTSKLLALLALSSTACYRYAQVPEAAPFPERGAEVRVTFSPPRSLNLGTITVHDITTLEGEVYRNLPDTLAVFSRWLNTAYGGKRATNGAVFYIPQGEIRQLDERRLLPLQTGLATATAIAAVFAVFKLALKSGGGSTPGEPPPIDDAQIVLPLSIGIPVGRW